jgi:hypothetical protein
VVAALSGCGAGSRAAGEPSVVAHWLAAINTQRWAEACALMTRSAQSEDGSSCIDSLKRSVAGAKVRYLRKETVTYIFGTADRATIYVFATMRGNKAIGRGGVVLTRKPGLQFIAAAIYTGSYL